MSLMWNGAICLIILLLLPINVKSSNTYSLCPDSVGVNHCVGLKKLRLVCMKEYKKLKWSIKEGRRLNEIEERMVKYLRGSIDDIVYLENSIDSFMDSNRIQITLLCDKILEENFIAKNGAISELELKNIIPNIKQLMHTSIEIQKGSFPDNGEEKIVEERKQRSVREGWDMKRFLIFFSLVLNLFLVIYLVKNKKG